MHPEQPDQPPANPYQFILEPPKAPKRSLLPNIGDGNSWLLKISVLVGGAVVLMIIIALGVNLFFGSKSNIDDLVSLTQTETELLRLSRQDDTLVDQNLKNTLATTAATIESHRQTWIKFVGSRGRQLSEKELALKASATTDLRLKTAQQSNTFDKTFSDIMRTQLTSYASQIQTAYDTAGNATEKTDLQTQYKETKLLITQWTPAK
jgi:hypothetical protein